MLFRRRIKDKEGHHCPLSAKFSSELPDSQSKRNPRVLTSGFRVRSDFSFMKIHLDPVAKFHRDTRTPSGLLVLGPHSLATASLPGSRWREFARWAPQGI